MRSSLIRLKGDRFKNKKKILKKRRKIMKRKIVGFSNCVHAFLMLSFSVARFHKLVYAYIMLVIYN